MAILQHIGATDGKLAAGDAAVFKHRYFRLPFLRLRVSAPAAAQRATFEKYVCAKPRSIVYGVALNVENYAGGGVEIWLSHSNYLKCVVVVILLDNLDLFNKSQL